MKLMEGQKKTKIGFDLDGVLCDKPPLMPKYLIERLFKGSRKGLHYRFPKSKFEQQIRKLSHYYLFRPLIKNNFSLIQRYCRDKNCQLYLISSRYSFLEKETHNWLRKRKIDHLFKEIFLNLGNEEPYLFKEKIIRKLKPDIFIEDDLLIVDYLKQKFPKLKINP